MKIEEWAQQKNVADWLLAAAKTRMRWAQGREVSEADFDKGVSETLGLRLSGYADQDKAAEEMKRQVADAQQQRQAQAEEAARSQTLEAQVAATPVETKKEG